MVFLQGISLVNNPLITGCTNLVDVSGTSSGLLVSGTSTLDFLKWYLPSFLEFPSAVILISSLFILVLITCFFHIIIALSPRAFPMCFDYTRDLSEKTTFSRLHLWKLLTIFLRFLHLSHIGSNFFPKNEAHCFSSALAFFGSFSNIFKILSRRLDDTKREVLPNHKIACSNRVTNLSTDI